MLNYTICKAADAKVFSVMVFGKSGEMICMILGFKYSL